MEDKEYIKCFNNVVLPFETGYSLDKEFNNLSVEKIVLSRKEISAMYQKLCL